jgi:hypothetical protein
MKIEMGKKYTSNGELVRILCVDSPDPIYPVVAVRNDGKVLCFKEDGAISYRYMALGENFDKWKLIEVWEPQPNEWCWFWDDKERDNTHLRRYSGMPSKRECEFFKSMDGVSWKYCAKFTGELPEHLKDK